MTFKFNRSYPIFPNHTIPEGFLTIEKECQACWYYYILCQKQKELVGRGPEDQTIVVDVGHEGDVHWMDKHYAQTLRSIAFVYDVAPEAILRHFDKVIREAQRQELPVPAIEYMNPKRFII
jgi:hypothetical protein